MNITNGYMGKILKPSLKTAVGVSVAGIIVGIVASQYSHSLEIGIQLTLTIIILTIATWKLHRIAGRGARGANRVIIGVFFC